MKVIGWIDYNQVEKWMDESIGGFGGFFKDGMRWEDYISSAPECGIKYYEALRDIIILENLKYTGSQHQHLDGGVPVFADGTIATFSFRAWGDLMAAIWSTEENKDYSYMDFYC